MIDLTELNKEVRQALIRKKMKKRIEWLKKQRLKQENDRKRQDTTGDTKDNRGA